MQGQTSCARVSTFGSGDTALPLQKALYSLKQSPRLWQLTLKAALKRLEYLTLIADQCIYRSADTGLIIITYMDDFLLIGLQEGLKKLKQQLSEAFDIKDLGQCQYFLGVRFIQDRQRHQVTLCQDAYIHKTLDQFSILECRAVSIPHDLGASESLVPYQGTASED